MSNLEKLGDSSSRLLKWAEENRAELDRRSAEYDRREAERRQREKAISEAYLERIRGLSLTQHPGAVAKPLRDCCLIHGPVGVGKTRLLNEHLLSVPRDQAIFFGFMDFLDVAQRIENDRASDFDRVRYSAAFRRAVLGLDDFGARRVTAFAVDCVLKLLSAREDKTRFRTIVTSNFTLGELAQDWDDRIVSRIRGFGPPLLLEGPDWRVRATARPETMHPRFLRFPRHAEASERLSQSDALQDLDSGRPRIGGGSRA